MTTCEHKTAAADMTWFGYVHVQYKCPHCGAMLTYAYDTGKLLHDSSAPEHGADINQALAAVERGEYSDLPPLGDSRRVPPGELGQDTRMRITCATTAGLFGAIALVSVALGGLGAGVVFFGIAALAMYGATHKRSA